eukprot:3085789-Rhodomonas_salina.4
MICQSQQREVESLPIEIAMFWLRLRQPRQQCQQDACVSRRARANGLTRRATCSAVTQAHTTSHG